MLKRTDFKTKITLIYVTAITLVALILGIYMYVRSYTETRESAINTQKHSAELLVNRLDDYLDNYQTISFMLASDSTLINLRSEKQELYDIVLALNNHIEPDIYFFLNQNPAIADITIYVENSHEVPSRFFAELDTFTSSEWYNKVDKNSAMQLVNIDDSIMAISPIKNHYSTQKKLGYVCVEIDTDVLFTEALAEYTNLNMQVLSANGKEIFNDTQKQDVTICSLTPNNIEINLHFSVNKQLIEVASFNIFAPVLLMVSIAIFVGLLFMEILRKNLYEVKQKQLELELETLQVRVDPHFLYNIMDTINWIAIEGDFERICEISSELSTYYRTNLNDGKSVTTLARELENIQSYLRLQMIAMSNSFDVEYDIDESLLNCQICNCTLQPLVENAVLHGIKPLRGRRGKIIVRFLSAGNDILLNIIDNGVGLEQKSFFTQKGSGYGIRNVTERIKLYFGKEYDVSIQSREDEQGTLATVRIPKRYNT